MASKARELANLGNAYSDGALSNRNRIINGNFEVWQRGTSFSGVNSPRYTADRWQVYGAGSTIVDVTRQAFSAGQTDVEGNPRYFMRIDNTPDPDTTWMETWQRIEDVTYFSGVTVTLSFWIRSNRNISNQNYFGFFQNFGSGGSTTVGTNSSNFDITTSWQKKTLTVTLPSISGKTIGSGNYLEIHLLQTSSIQADTYYDIAQVQLEVGDTATPFEHRSYGQELALCQRYYWRKDSGTGSWSAATQRSTVQSEIGIQHPVAMRANPTLGYSGTWFIGFWGSSATITSFVYNVNGTVIVDVQANHGSGGASGRAVEVFASAGAYIDFDAEL